MLVRDSIAGVAESILIGLALSVLVLLVFLKSWRTTLVAAVVIPIAVLIAVVFMQLFNMSFNLMTLGGLAACIGVVIDDAIVMVENIIVHLSMGQSPSEAARSAITELTPALIGSTLTPIMVFVPLVFLGGITARVLPRAGDDDGDGAARVAVPGDLLYAGAGGHGFSSRVRAGEAEADIEKAEQVGRRPHPALADGALRGALHWSLCHPRTILLARVVVLGWNGGRLLPARQRLPAGDGRGRVRARLPDARRAPRSQETDRVLRHIEQFLRETPEVESYSRRTGARLALAIAEPNTGDFLIKLKQERKRALEEVTAELRRKIVSSEPAIEVEFPHILEDLIGDLAWSPQPIEIKVHHDDADGLQGGREADRRMAAKGERRRGHRQPDDRHRSRRSISASILEKARRAGFGVKDVADLEAAMLDGELASDMIRGDRLIGIRVRYPVDYRSSTEKLKALLLTSPTGQTVPLSSIANVEVEEGTTEIRRENLTNMSAVTARLENATSAPPWRKSSSGCPRRSHCRPGTDIEYGGLYQIQRESFLGLTQVLLLSILLIFIILVFEFRSFSHPIAILAATILCGSGALVALWITGTTLNISSFMGAIMVVGIVHKNGILMLDSEQYFSEQGYELREAIFHAGRRRLRPILMTALATIFGMLPLALGVGSGAQLLQPLAIAVIGGVTVSMVLSLLITPVLFFQLRQRGL